MNDKSLFMFAWVTTAGVGDFTTCYDVIRYLLSTFVAILPTLPYPKPNRGQSELLQQGHA